MHPADLLIIALFTLIVFATGMSFSGSGSGMKAFFAAGGAVPWWINGLSLFMSFFSAGTFVVWGSIAYSQGWVSVSIQWTMCIAGLLVGWFIAARWRRTGAMTVAEYLTQRLGYGAQKTYTWLFLLISLFTTGAFLYPVAKILEVSTHIDIRTSIVVLGILITFYTATGGLWAVIVTDVLQFVVLTASVCLVVPLALREAGGWDTFVAQTPEGFFALTNEQYPPAFLVAFGLYNMVFIGGNWAYVQRYTSVATPHEARKVGWMFGALYALSPVVWMLPPMLYRIVQPDLQGLGDEGAYLLMCKRVLPVGLLGLLLSGMVFATASSVNTTLNIAAGVLTNDVYKRFFPLADDRQLMRFARLSTAVFGVLTIGVALAVPLLGGIVEVVLSVAAITGTALYLPPIWTLFSRRQTAVSLLSTTIISLAVGGFFKFAAPLLGMGTLGRAAEMGLGVALPVALLACWELYYALSGKAASSPAPSTAEADEPTPVAVANQEGVRKIGLGILAIGLLMIGISFWATGAEAYTLGMGLMVAGVGAWLFFKTQGRI